MALGSRKVLYSGYVQYSKANQDYLSRLSSQLVSLGNSLFVLDLSFKSDDSNNFSYVESCDELISNFYLIPGLKNKISEAVKYDSSWERNEKSAHQHILKYVQLFLGWVLSNKPALVIFSIERRGAHICGKYICDWLGIEYLFTSRGILPGTICYEKHGLVGKSDSQTEISKWKEVSLGINLGENNKRLSYFYETNRTRKPQAEYCKKIEELVLNCRSKGRKVLFLIGDHEFSPGIRREDNNDANYHSPHFRSVESVISELILLAETRNFEIFFKPHPNLGFVNYDSICKNNRIHLLKDANIFQLIENCDLAVTVYSQVAYSCLWKEKPVLLLGRNQLSGYDCCFEVSDKSDMSYKIDQAFKEGYSLEMKNAFDRHLLMHLSFMLHPGDGEMENVLVKTMVDTAQFLNRNQNLRSIICCTVLWNLNRLLRRWV